MKKAAFFDIDGTICEEITMHIPESTRVAIRSLRENGVYAFINSGRTRCFIRNPKLLDLGFDGIISGCGTQVDYKDDTIFYYTIPQEVVRSTVDIFRKYHRSLVLEGRHHLYVTEPEFKEGGYLEALQKRMDGMIEDVETHANEWEVSKFSAPMYGEAHEDVLNGLGSWYEFLIHQPSHWSIRPILVEGIPKGYTKATGIQTICKALGIAQEDTYAFGDSVNDVDMLKYAGHGIVMGDGSDEAKTAGNYVTSAIGDDGIYNACKHFQLI